MYQPPLMSFWLFPVCPDWHPHHSGSNNFGIPCISLFLISFDLFCLSWLTPHHTGSHCTLEFRRARHLALAILDFWGEGVQNAYIGLDKGHPSFPAVSHLSINCCSNPSYSIWHLYRTYAPVQSSSASCQQNSTCSFGERVNAVQKELSSAAETACLLQSLINR